MRKRLREVAAFFGKESRQNDWITRATLDSRSVSAGSLFFALKGKQFDGHAFLDEVVRRGGCAAVVSAGYRKRHEGLELFPVPDVREALQGLARFVLGEKSPLIIGVTGTVGKTTTKEFLGEILGEKFRVSKSPKNWNSQLGLPLAVLNEDGEEEMLILEMGMSQKGEIERLVSIAPPHIGVLTQVGIAHGAFFETVEEIAEAKCELFSSKNMRHAFLNQTVRAFPIFEALSVPKSWFGCPGFASSLREPHLLENLGAAVAVAKHLGMTREEILRGVERVKPMEHRGERIEKRGALFIDDAYNASPLSFKAALKSLPLGKRRIGVLGAMKELGRFEAESHRQVAECAFPILDDLLCLGKECLLMVDFFRENGKPAELFEKKEDVVKRLRDLLKEGDVVLVKGSNAWKLWTVIEEI